MREEAFKKILPPKKTIPLKIHPLGFQAEDHASPFSRRSDYAELWNAKPL